MCKSFPLGKIFVIIFILIQIIIFIFTIKNNNKEEKVLIKENKNLPEIKSFIQDEEKFKNVYIKENDFNSKDILIKENNNITNIETTIDNKNEKFVPKEKSHKNINEVKKQKITVIFKSLNPIINYQITCDNSETFSEIEKKICLEFPELIEKKIEFIANGNKINKSKSLYQNNIKDNTIIEIKIIPSKKIDIFFNSKELKIYHKIMCNDTDRFSKIIPQLYEKFPQLKEKNVLFKINEEKVDKSVTLEQNNIENNSEIIMVISDKKIINISFRKDVPNIDKNISCYDSDIFSKIEKKLYSEEPDLNKKYFFLCNGDSVEKSETFYENKIQDKDIIIIAEINEEEKMVKKEDKENKNNNKLISVRIEEDFDEIKNELIAVIFRTTNQEINCAIFCYIDDPFPEVEKKLYLKYPQLKEKKYLFQFNRQAVNKLATLRENNIRNSSVILLIEM